MIRTPETVISVPGIHDHLHPESVISLQRNQRSDWSGTRRVVERWNRTLKEQAIHGRIFNTVDDVRKAVREFVENHNQEWRLEKLGYLTPIEARQEELLRHAA